jgi:DNA-binding transcriptional MerR regulator
MNTGNDNKKFYTIKDVADITGIKQTVLRFWEMEFEDLRIRKNKFGHRIYTDDDIKLIRKIKVLLYEKGLTIKGAKKVLNEKSNVNFNFPNIKELKGKLQELLSILKIHNDNNEGS